MSVGCVLLYMHCLPPTVIIYSYKHFISWYAERFNNYIDKMFATSEDILLTFILWCLSTLWWQYKYNNGRYLIFFISINILIYIFTMILLHLAKYVCLLIFYRMSQVGFENIYIVEYPFHFFCPILARIRGQSRSNIIYMPTLIA